MLLDDPLRNGQSQARTLRIETRRNEGIEDIWQYLRRDAGAVVLNSDRQQRLAFPELRVANFADVKSCTVETVAR